MPSTLTPTRELLQGAIKLDQTQARFFHDDARVQVACWHRQKGKDFTAALKGVFGAAETGQDWYIVSLTQRQADETFEKCKRVAKALRIMLDHRLRETHTDFTERDDLLKREFQFQAHELRLPRGGKVVSLPGRNPDTLAGFTGNIILTEFGLFPGGGYDHWGVLFPIITRGGYQVIAISTPRGKNTKFYELVHSPELYSVHVCDIYQSVYEEGYQLFDGKGNAFDQSTRALQEKAIAAFRRLYADEAKWPREYECKFTGDMSALVTYAQLEAAGHAGRDKPFNWLRIDNDNRGSWTPQWFKAADLSARPCRLEIGWDVARTGDLSSLWCNVAEPGKAKALRFLALMHKTTFALQREVVRSAMKSLPNCVGAGDATGLGMDSNETLQAEFGKHRWLPFTFSGKGKSELGSIGATAFDGAGQCIPRLDGEAGFVGMDIAGLQADRTSGTLRLDEGANPLLPDSHCDVAYSCLLALKAASLIAATPGIIII